ncbi:MAG: helical backbone metal receptor [Bacteroidales bacterium]
MNRLISRIIWQSYEKILPNRRMAGIFVPLDNEVRQYSAETQANKQDTSIYQECMMEIRDDLGNTIILKKTPRRIVSLCPSITQTIFDLGAGALMAGVTDYCIHPLEKTRRLPSVGGPARVSKARIMEIAPDLIIASMEENTKDQVLELQRHFPVFVFHITSFNHALQMILRIGEMTGQTDEAIHMTIEIMHGFSGLRLPSCPHPCLYFVWKNPYMVAGHNTFITDMLERSGFSNHLPLSETGYKKIRPGEISGCPDLLLPSEPYPFDEADVEEMEGRFPGSRAHLVDGEIFGWYGSMMLRAPAYLREQYSGILREDGKKGG